MQVILALHSSGVTLQLKCWNCQACRQWPIWLPAWAEPERESAQNLKGRELLLKTNIACTISKERQVQGLAICMSEERKQCWRRSASCSKSAWPKEQNHALNEKLSTLLKFKVLRLYLLKEGSLATSTALSRIHPLHSRNRAQAQSHLGPRQQMTPLCESWSSGHLGHFRNFTLSCQIHFAPTVGAKQP